MTLGNLVNTINTSTDQEHSLSDDVLESYLQGLLDRNEISFRESGFHPSSAAYWCQRQEVFRHFMPRPESKFDSKTLSLFGAGTAAHEYWQNKILGPMRVLWGTWMCSRCRYKVEGLMPNHVCPVCEWSRDIMVPQQERETCAASCRWQGGYSAEDRDCGTCGRWGEWAYKETRISEDKYGIVGHADGIIYEDGVKKLLELKTINPSLWKSLKAPYGSHVLQTTIYMHCLGLTKVLFIYIDKNNYLPKTFEEEYSPGLWRRTEIILQSIIDGINNAELPLSGKCQTPRDKDAISCPWRDECFDPIFDLKSFVDRNNG